MTLIITLVARLFGISPDLAKVIAAMVGIFASLASGWALTEYIKHRGAAEERAKIERQNNDAIRKGIDANRSFDDCVAAGGLWDFRRQRCASAPKRPR